MAFNWFAQPHCMHFVAQRPRWGVDADRACRQARTNHCSHTKNTLFRWAEARIKIARMTLTIKLDGNWNSFQLANNTPPLSVTGSVIAPSARMTVYKSYSTSGAVRTCGIISRVSHHLGSGGLRHLLQMYVNISAARQSADI
jgi:hypothetical protein